ncbi:unnamed protein product [Blepharisma stoltei]|uniref:Uncharacterized protein n=1 Tax=Blepharisma stoltei TaxID=1481888 RepID=A0AAU9JXD7_9CILI|nr:unnamed protein product [Blepharisma stoltei]
MESQSKSNTSAQPQPQRNPKKPSLFAMKMGLQPQPLPTTEILASSIKEKDPNELKYLESLHTDFPQNGFPEAFQLEENFEAPIPKVSIKNSELESISQNNFQKVKEMSSSELKEAMDEINSLVDPKMIEVLRKRGHKKLNHHEVPSQHIENHVDLNENQLKKLMKESPKPTCLHDNLPPENEIEKWRFDFEGNSIQHYENKNWTNPELQGFGLRDLVNMSRSSIPSQRSIALDCIIKIIDKSDEVKFGEGVDFLIEECEFDRVLVWVLDDSNINVRISGLQAVKYITCKFLERNLEIIDKWGFAFPSGIDSKRNALLPEEIRKKSAIWEEEEYRSIFDLPFESNTKDLIGRMICIGLLDKLSEFLENSNMGYIWEDCLNILLACSLHSSAAAYAIIRNKNLVSQLPPKISKFPIILTIFTFLSKAALSIAYNIKRLYNWDEILLSNLLLDQNIDPNKEIIKKSLLLIHSFYCHNQRLMNSEAMRLSLLEIIKKSNDFEILDYAFMTISRIIDTLKDSSEYLAHFEVFLYKYLENWRDTGRAFAGGIKFLNSLINFGKNIPIEGQTYSMKIEKLMNDYIIPIINSFEMHTEIFQISSILINDSSFLHGLENYFHANCWEKSLVQFYKIANSLLEFYINFISISSAKIYPNIEWLNSALDNAVSLLHNFENFIENNAIPKIISYRVKPLVYFIINCLKVKKIFKQLSEARCKSAFISSIIFLGSYDESILEFLINNFINFENLNFYNGFLSTQKHIELSDAYFSNSTRISTWYLCNNETEFLPLPLHWQYIPLHSEANLENYFQFILEYIEFFDPKEISKIIESINKCIMRKDVEFLGWKEKIGPILKFWGSRKNFAISANKIRTNVMELVKDYVGCSYLDEVYSMWLVCFLQDGIEESFYKDIIEEIGLLWPRFIGSLNVEELKSFPYYTKFFKSLRSNN